MSKVDQAVSCYMKDFTCGQAILSTYSTQFGLDPLTSLKLATGFGGGIARLGKICGAVNAAIMVIGLKYGRSKIEDIEAKEKTYRLTREFINRFQEINGSITCKQLLGCDINTPKGRKYAEKNDLYKIICPRFVQNAAEILEQLL